MMENEFATIYILKFNRVYQGILKFNFKQTNNEVHYLFYLDIVIQYLTIFHFFNIKWTDRETRNDPTILTLT